MSLPVYQHLNFKSSSLEDLDLLLNPEINLKHPVVLNLKAMDRDQQREVIGLIENYFVSHNLSFKFPYPIYVVTDHETSITQIPIVNDAKELPKFFSQRDSKMNVKEAHLVGKNKLLQQEVKNCDASSNATAIESYADSHRIIYGLETERTFYRSILNRLMKVKKNG